jgi:hypothetical protein
MGIESSKASKVVDVLSSSRVSKGNSNGAFIIGEGSFIVAKRSEKNRLNITFHVSFLDFE